MLNTKQSFSGTAKEFTAANIHINDVKVTPQALSHLATHGIVRITGKAPKPAGVRGPQENIYTIDTNWVIKVS
jgi:hypothetical protein